MFDFAASLFRNVIARSKATWNFPLKTVEQPVESLTNVPWGSTIYPSVKLGGMPYETTLYNPRGIGTFDFVGFCYRYSGLLYPLLHYANYVVTIVRNKEKLEETI